MTPTLAYDVIKDTALGQRPDEKASEIDEWIGKTQTSWEIYEVLNSGEDFARASDEHQRMYFLVCTEVLYGPNRDDALRTECQRLTFIPL